MVSVVGGGGDEGVVSVITRNLLCFPSRARVLQLSCKKGTSNFAKRERSARKNFYWQHDANVQLKGKLDADEKHQLFHYIFRQVVMILKADQKFKIFNI